MKKVNFTHLHVHSEYSLLDSTCKIKELISKTKELGMDSIAITDHGVMYGIIGFYKEAVAQGIKPIIGCEVYVSSGSRLSKEASKDNFYYHLVLLAENDIGYKNLIKLVSIGFTEGFYYKPRVDIEVLEKYKEGIIALSACLSGPISKNLLKVSYDRAKDEALKYKNLFGENNFYLEIQDHNLPNEKRVNPQIIKISEELNIPLVCTNDVHYINKEDAEAHDVFLCVQTGKTMADADRMSYGTDELYLKSPEQMLELFSYKKEAIDNTYEISKRCNVTIEFNNYHLPKFKLNEGEEPAKYLENLCMLGLNQKLQEVTPEIKERLFYELDVINNMGFADYFLIVWDFIRYANENDIIVGPGRGSAAGSIVAYALNITNVNPIKYDLLFERFLNPERVTMPDIDIDFCYVRRQEVIDYVVNKYGKDHVAQIITFGTLGARAAIRDTGRALGVAYQTVDTVAKMIPFELNITIEKSLNMNHELMELYSSNKEINSLINMSLKLEGLPRHASTHAAGVVICNEEVTEYVPLNQNDGVITTQFTMTTLEELGLLKMDFLGLRTLTVINDALKEIKRNHKIDINFTKMDFDDPKVFELIGSGKTDGIFQLESSGMKNFMKTLMPTSLEDIIAGISLYRPGPMDFIPKYIKGKNESSSIKYLDKKLEPILNSTYGCIVYQEQVMQIFRNLAGYSLGRSDLVRRAMSKKKVDVMEKERSYFIEGCNKNNISTEVAIKIFDEMADFAKYAFNKSHAAAYAVIGYETAYLKHYYPVEFMAALISSVMDGKITKVASYIDEAKRLGISLLSPDINESFEFFSVKDKSIRFGLAAIKNVGRPTIKNIVKEREQNGNFTSLTEFINRMDSKDLNKRTIESLIKAGAFDSLGGMRKQYLNIFKPIIEGNSTTKRNNIEGQIDLFSMISVNVYKDVFTSNEEYKLKELLQMEKDVIGIYISGHPLNEYINQLKNHINATSLDFENALEDSSFHDDDNVCIGGLIVKKSIKYTKNNKTMAFLTLEDLHGVIEVILFPNVYDKYSSKINEDEIIIVSGKLSLKEDEDPKVICNTIMFYSDMNNKTLWLKIKEDKNITPDNLLDFMKNYKGNTPVIVYDEKTKQKLKVEQDFWVASDEQTINSFKNLLGGDAVVLV